MVENEETTSATTNLDEQRLTAIGSLRDTASNSRLTRTITENAVKIETEMSFADLGSCLFTFTSAPLTSLSNAENQTSTISFAMLSPRIVNEESVNRLETVQAFQQ